jgi:poly-gamma-glutamate capsule biosynthesis protein CapA/YwtB (metallophosphatase superfamily)
MYFATLNSLSGDLVELRMTPMQIRQMRLNRAAPRDGEWLADTLTRISVDFGSWVEGGDNGGLLLRLK